MAVYRSRRRRVQRVLGWQLQPVARGRARSALHRVVAVAHAPGTITDEQYQRSIVRSESHFGVAGLYSGTNSHALPAPRKPAPFRSPMLVGCCGSGGSRKRTKKKRSLLVGLARTFKRKKHR